MLVAKDQIQVVRKASPSARGQGKFVHHPQGTCRTVAGGYLLFGLFTSRIPKYQMEASSLWWLLGRRIQGGVSKMKVALYL